jgi:hypothetical protein
MSELEYGPQEDITLYEFSKVIIVLLAINNGTLKTTSQAEKLLEQIGPEAARHFKFIEVEEKASEPSYT